MGGTQTLGALRRRWWVIIIFAVAGGIVGAIPEPERVEERERTFTATHTMLLNNPDTTFGQPTTAGVAPTQVTLFVQVGEVPKRAAEAIDFSGNPASLASQIVTEFDFTSNSLTITSTQNDGARAELIADTFADELIAYLAERNDVFYQERLAASLERLTELEIELTEITAELASNPDDPVLTAQQSAISRQYSVAFEQSEALAAAPAAIQFTTLERAQAVEITDRGIGAPASRSSRALLGAGVGALVGIGVALLLAQLDRRVRTREQAEELLEMRSRVMIPKVRDKDRDQVIVEAHRHDALSDSYRTVRSLVEFVQSREPERGRAPITLVVSPSAGDGKTAVAANLAAADAEAGRRTVLINTDFRRPRLSKIMGPGADEPLPFLLGDIERLHSRTLLSRTGMNRLRLFDLSRVDASAGDLVRATIAKLPELTALSDAVVIDSSPVGSTAEVLELVPHADTIVVVVRVGHTRVADIHRTVSILRDLATAPTILVLGGLKPVQAQYYEYDDRRKKPEQRPPRRRWWRRRRSTDAVPAGAVFAPPVPEGEGGDADTTDEMPNDAVDPGDVEDPTRRFRRGPRRRRRGGTDEPDAELELEPVE